MLSGLFGGGAKASTSVHPEDENRQGSGGDSSHDHRGSSGSIMSSKVARQVVPVTGAGDGVTAGKGSIELSAPLHASVISFFSLT